MIYIKLTKNKLDIKFIKNNLIVEELVLETRQPEAVIVTDVICSFIQNCTQDTTRPNSVSGFNFSQSS